MNRRLCIRLCIPLAVIAALTAFRPIASIYGQEEDRTVKIELHPMAFPCPALKYQLLPPYLERRPGNAILQYLKIPHENTALFSNMKFWEDVEMWGKLPLPELRKKLAEGKDNNAWITSSEWTIWKFLEQGARCESAEWDFPIRESRDHFWSIPLPDVQAARAPGRILAARARIQIAQGKFDDAIKTLQVGFAMGRHVGEPGTFLVQSLVGITISDIMANQTLTFLQEPKAPNLYWAIASLPRPFISIHRPMEIEKVSVYLHFPELQDIDNKEYSPEQWRQLMEKIVDSLEFLRSGRKNEKTLQKLSIMNNIIAGYPKAKQELIDRGRSAEEVEAMPVAQVIVLYTMHTFDELCDDQFKWMNMPYPLFKLYSKKIEQDLHDAVSSGKEIIPLASTLLPAVVSCKRAETRLERNFAALQILEALRMYGATHDRQLPENLKDITEVPIPMDPFTGEPFVYHRNGDTAVLESENTPCNSSCLRYEIHFANQEEK